MRNEASLLDCEEFDIWQMLAGSTIFPSRDTYRLSNVSTFKFFIPYPVKTRDTPKRISQ